MIARAEGDCRAEAMPRPMRRLIEFARSCRAAGEPFSDEAYSRATGLALSSVRTYCRAAIRNGWWPDGLAVAFVDRPVRLLGDQEAGSGRPADVIMPALEIVRELLPLRPAERATALEVAGRLLNYLESGGG